jgi:cytidine deaminase
VICPRPTAARAKLNCMSLGIPRVAQHALDISDAAAPFAHDVDPEALFRRAHEARDRAYAPYSQLRIGAALLTSTGDVFTAGNVENGSYGLTICAERAAVARAVAEGQTDLVAIAVSGDTERVHTLACCGACLQVLAEFDPAGRLVVAFPSGDVLRVTLLRELLPVQFRLRPEAS